MCDLYIPSPPPNFLRSPCTVTRQKDGENRIFDEVTPVATLEVLSINKPDETCTNADDQIIVLQHGGVASVDLDEFLEQTASDD